MIWEEKDNENNCIKLYDQCSWNEESKGMLTTVFKNGKLIRKTTFAEIKNKLNGNNN